MSGLIPDLGRHAAYIWVSLGAGALGLGLMALASWRRMARLEAAARAALEQRL